MNDGAKGIIGAVLNAMYFEPNLSAEQQKIIYSSLQVAYDQLDIAFNDAVDVMMKMEDAGLQISPKGFEQFMEYMIDALSNHPKLQKDFKSMLAQHAFETQGG